jgi:hypothetical protein
MGRVGRWRGVGRGGRQPYVGRHEARRRRTAARVAVAVAVAAAAVAAVAPGLRSTGPRVEPPRGPPPTPASILIAAPGFGVGVEGWRALPATFVIKGRLGAPTASYARVQRDPTGPARRDPATRSAVTGMATRVRVGATVGLRLRATVRVRASRPGTTVVVRLVERVGDREVGGGERRATLAGTGWRQVVAAHRVRRAGAAVYLEISALALPRTASFDVDQAKVTSP